MKKVAVLLVWSISSVLITTGCFATQPEKSKLEQNKEYVKDIVQTYGENISKFHKNFCQSITGGSLSAGGSRFSQLVAAEFCKRAMGVFPGSTLNCYDCSGTWVSGTQKAIYATGGLLIQEENTFGTWKINVGYRHGSRYLLDSIIVTVTDLAGTNYITLRYDELQNVFGTKKHPKYSIQDARLPDTIATEMSSAVRSPAIKISHNELITVLNSAYKNYPYKLYDFAIELVTNQQFRRDVINYSISKK